MTSYPPLTLQQSVDRFQYDVANNSCTTRNGKLDDLRSMFEHQLSDDRAKALFNALQTPDIEALAENIDAESGYLNNCGGMDAKDRAGFYGVLAQKLTGEQMALLAVEGRDHLDAREIGAAMAALPSTRNEDKLNFIKVLEGSTLNEVGAATVRSDDGVFHDSKHVRSNPFGAAIVECMRGLADSPADFDKAMSVLGIDGAVPALVGGLGRDTAVTTAKWKTWIGMTATPEPHTTFSPEPTIEAIDNAALHGNESTRCIARLAGENVWLMLPEIEPTAKTQGVTQQLDDALSRLRREMPIDSSCTIFRGEGWM
jgi:hypothetical protein